MKSLNTVDFINAYIALDSAKYPALDNKASAYTYLSTFLAVAIEQGLTTDQIQARLDERVEEYTSALATHNLAQEILADLLAGA